ncbi:MAG TPA: hypothetical protein VGC79_30490 [Polyangiaceae bacterium]
MHDEQVTLMREVLYEQLWKTPMSRLAAEFGISDVALAKICKKLDVPIPGRGYWARVTNGQKVKQPKLPKARADTRTEYTIAKHEPRVATATVDVPDVRISDSLLGAHPIVTRIKSELGRGGRGGDYLRGNYEASFSVTKAEQQRALLIFDALLKALESRGHLAQFDAPKDAEWGTYKLSVKIGDEAIELCMAEPMQATKHEIPVGSSKREEILARLTHPRTSAPSGRLRLRAREGYSPTRSWSDGGTRGLEDILGRVVSALEDFSRQVHAQRLEREESNRRWKDEKKRQQIPKVLCNYANALGEELLDAVERFRSANAIREFVCAAASASVPADKLDAVRQWLAWAASWADRLDPLGELASEARLVAPDPGRMPEDEFNYWYGWPETEKRVSAGYGGRFEPRGV